MAASWAMADQVARSAGKRHVIRLARNRKDGLPTGDAENLARHACVPPGSAAPLQKITQCLSRYQVWATVIATRQPCLDPAAYGAAINSKATSRFVNRIGAMNLDQPWIDLAPLARRHRSADADAGLGLPLRLAATRPATHALTSASSHPTAFVDNRIGGGKLPAAISRYSDDRLSPVVRWTSRRRMIRSRPASNWMGWIPCGLRVRASRASMESAERAPGRRDADGFILAVLGCAGNTPDSQGSICTQDRLARKMRSCVHFFLNRSPSPCRR